MKKKRWKILRTIWVMAGVVFFIWMWWSVQAHGIDNAIFESDADLQVTNNNNYLAFIPTDPNKQLFIFYPGALVDPKAYAPLCRKIAATGIKSMIIKMPWRMANHGYNKPKELNLFTDTSVQYILAGHSQGAKMAAQFVYENPTLVDRLVLIATTHPRDYDLSLAHIPILKIYGTNDAVASPNDIESNKSKLPASTKYVLIDGANHAQFGYYGFQLGDNSAGISREAQQQQTLDHILSFINESSK